MTNPENGISEKFYEKETEARTTSRKPSPRRIRTGNHDMVSGEGPTPLARKDIN